MLGGFVRIALLLLPVVLCQCTSSLGPPNMGGPSVERRAADIAAEPAGDYFVGRRYHVKKTRFWGYVRKPRQPWGTANLVVMREDKKRTPDRLPEYGGGERRFGFDQNYEYKLRGYYTGRQVYDPNSNQKLPEFMLTGYTLLKTKPGWIFKQDDHYDPHRITLYNR